MRPQMHSKLLPPQTIPCIELGRSGLSVHCFMHGAMSRVAGIKLLLGTSSPLNEQPVHASFGGVKRQGRRGVYTMVGNKGKKHK